MQTSYNKENVAYAGFFVRLAAFLLDSILIGICLWIIKVPVWFIELAVGDAFLFKPFLFEYNIFDVLYYLLTTAYFVLTTYYCGATVGKRLMKLRVVDVEGQKLSFVTVLLRETVGRYLSALIIYIGYIMVGVDNCKQGLHDKISDTYVVYMQNERKTKVMESQKPQTTMGPLQSTMSPQMPGEQQFPYAPQNMQFQMSSQTIRQEQPIVSPRMPEGFSEYVQSSSNEFDQNSQRMSGEEQVGNFSQSPFTNEMR